MSRYLRLHVWGQVTARGLGRYGEGKMAKPQLCEVV